MHPLPWLELKPDNAEQLELGYIAMENTTSLEKQLGGFLNMYILSNAALPLLNMYSPQMITYVRPNICILVFTEALFITAKP